MLFKFPGSLCLLSAAAGATALRIDAQAKRADDQSHVVSLDNNEDLAYKANITLNGQVFEVIIDTGRYVKASLLVCRIWKAHVRWMIIHSSDLWISGTVNNANDTGKTAKVQYAVGGVSGSIQTAKVQFLGYEIDDQAFSAYY